MSNLKIYQEAGFEGFKTIRELMDDINAVPKDKGIYLILQDSKSMPNFIKQGTGGFFKEKNPNVPIQDLEKNWIKDEPVLYIGKAGGKTQKKDGTVSNSKATLQSRIEQYMRFGQGEPIGHWGGRLIWQLADAKDLIVCWKVLGKDEEPREVEKNMIQEFKKGHGGKRPFANLQD